MKKIKIIAAILVFVVWFVFTFALPYITGTHKSDIPLSDLVTKGINYGIFLSALTCLLFSFLHRSQNRVGLAGFGKIMHPILIVPVLIIVFSLYVASTAGAFSNATLVQWVLINTLFVGISEELMFRGIFMSSFAANKGYWPAIIWSTVIFGAIHMLNGFTTGDFSLSTLQAVMATSSGLLFTAIRVRTLSIIPAIIVHWFWDFTVFVVTTSGLITNTSDNTSMGSLLMIVSLAMVAAPVVFGIIGILALLSKKAALAYMATQE